MVGKNIVLLNIKDNIKNAAYWMMSLLFSALSAFLMVQQGKVFVSNEGTAFVFHYLYFAFNLSSYAMIMTVAIANIAIADKSAGRLEFYLANGVDLNTLHRSYTIAAFILSLAAVAAFNVLLIAYGFMAGETAFIQRLYTVPAFLCFITYLALCISVTYLLNLIVFLSKKPQTTRSIIFLVSFFVFYGMLFPVQSLAKAGGFSSQGIIRVLTAVFAVFTVGVVCITSVLKRLLSKERIVLSLRQ